MNTDGVQLRQREDSDQRVKRHVKPFRYRAFGSCIESDTPLQGLVADHRSDPPDVTLWLSSKPAWVERALTLRRQSFPPADPFGWSTVHTLGEGASEFFHLIYSDGAEFVISDAGDRVYGHCPSELTLGYKLLYVMGPILGIALRRLGRICIHASAVTWNGRAVMFVGPPGAGKSTTAAAAVMRHGARMLTDDIVVLRRSRGEYQVEAGQAWLRLWQNSVGLLCGDEKALPLIALDWHKRYLDASHRSSLASPVERICFLGALTPSEHAAPLLESVHPRDALVLLVSNTYGERYVHAARRRNEFHMLSELAQDVPAVIAPDDHSARPLDALLEAVRDSFESVNRRAPCTRLAVTAK